MNERVNNFTSPTVSSPGLKTNNESLRPAKTAKDMETITMHVNKFVHPCEKIPAFIKASDLKGLSADYETKDLEDVRENLI